MNNRTLGLVIATLVGFVPLALQAQQGSSYPARPIRIIVPSTSGTPPDLIARVVGENLSSVLRQPVVVENRPGAGGTIGINAVAKSTPGGYTLGIIGMPAIVSASLIEKMPYDTQRDLVPVSFLAWDYNLFAVPAGLPARSVADLVAMAKARPGVLKFSSGGNGTPAHMGMELFKREAGVDMVHIPYKGSPAGVVALLAGDADMMIGSIAALSGHVTSGKLRALATPALRRVPAYPEVPTLAELGYSGLGTLGWQGMVVPTGSPGAIIARLHVEIQKILAAPELKARLASIGQEPASMATEAFGAHIRSELQRWARVVREAGIKRD